MIRRRPAGDWALAARAAQVAARDQGSVQELPLVLTASRRAWRHRLAVQIRPVLSRRGGGARYAQPLASSER